MKSILMNGMCGIKQWPKDDAERLVVLSASFAHSGRGYLRTQTQGIVLVHEALGYILAAFQAAI